ncbi:uncharacterized protein [Panulirus ornatus]|uniref:uncharacterized protein n=1 Tax=Panulirus ornatus TaxID=150431 RepID=UPI003A8BAECF
MMGRQLPCSLSGVLTLVLTAAILATFLSRLPPWFTSCTPDCLDMYMKGAANLFSPAMLAFLRDKFLEPPPPDPDRSGFDIDRPSWRHLLEWHKLQQNLKDLWKDQSPGVFVEVGAVDGEFMSQTLMLEKNLSWTGLLIEPDPRSYSVLQQRRRNAWTSPVCIRLGPTSARKLWMRDLRADLPQEMQGLVMARSKLDDETITGDMLQGRTTFVPCVRLSQLLLRANMTRADLLTIATGTPKDHLKIRDVTSDRQTFDVKTLLVQYPRSHLLQEPYPEIPGYILDMDRSVLLVRLFWRKADCRLLQEDTCRRTKPYDLMEACKKYLCNDFATVWTYK